MIDHGPAALLPGMAVRDPAGVSTPGLLGPILIDEETGQCYGLVAAQLIASGRPLIIGEGHARGFVVASGPIRTLASDADKQDCACLVAAVPLMHAAVSRQLYATRATEPAVLSRGQLHVDMDVNLELGTGQLREARVLSLTGEFLMPNPIDGQPTLYHGAIVLCSRDGARLVGPGDAGTLVTTQDGNWAAIVVAGSSTSAYAAPISPICKALRLSVISKRAIAESASKPSVPSLNRDPDMKRLALANLLLSKADQETASETYHVLETMDG